LFSIIARLLANVVLDLAVVADHDPVAYKTVLSHRHSLANAGPAANVDEMPNAGAVSYLGALVDDGAGMLEAVHRE
jgi:hypothetical protein